MSKTGKLELTWVGKNEEKRIEPRILVEDKSKSNIQHDKETENMLIHGDNLIALKALEQDYAGKIKCIYIDPPYNTGNAFEHYDDGVEHSIWLTLMKQRLELLKGLLSNDGAIVIQIDDNEQAYLKVLCDEIFGRVNHVNTIVVKMSDASGPKMAHIDKKFPKLKEYLLIYKKEKISINVQTEEKTKWDSEYKNFLDLSKEDIEKMLNLTNKNEIDEVNEKLPSRLISLNDAFKKYKVGQSDKDKFNFSRENAWRIARTSNASTIRRVIQNETDLNQNIAIAIVNDVTMFVKADFDRGSKEPRVQYVFASDTMNVPLGDLWLHINTSFNSEGGVTLKNGQKPESLIKTIIAAFSNPGDFVLDSFLGSGTTAAVAHKMNRKWIGIELGEQAYTHSKVRLDNVIEGEQTGISKDLDWTGGGGYRFYELAPSLLEKHPILPIYQVNNDYNFEMLCEAICKLEGFKYEPIGEMHGKSSEKRYIHISKDYISGEYIQNIVKELDENHSVLIYGTKIQSDSKLPENIEVKRIPKDLLKKYDFESEVR